MDERHLREDDLPHHSVAELALEEIVEGMVVGLGSGRAATGFVEVLGRRVREGLRVRGVPTSRATADFAQRVGIPLVTLAEVEMLDITVDGADEVDPDLDLIKGYGGAMVREKIVATASRRLLILVGQGKGVPRLGSRGKLPVEVVPFALATCRRKLESLGMTPELRTGTNGGPFITDNGNIILDCAVGPIQDPRALECELRATPGVVGTGLFLGMAEMVLLQEGESVEVRRRG